MNQQNEQTKQELAKQISQTNDPVLKRIIEKKLGEINKDIKKV